MQLTKKAKSGDASDSSVSSASSAAGPDLSQEELRDEFEDSGGKTDAIIVAGSKANITFEKEEYVDKILEFVTPGAHRAVDRITVGRTMADSALWLRAAEALLHTTCTSPRASLAA